jgi:RPC5 protein
VRNFRSLQIIFFDSFHDMPRPKDREPKDESFGQGQESIIIEDSIQDEPFSSTDDEECDDDPVVKTYDVFLSNQLKDHIYLLQYPIRNLDEEYLDENAPSLVRMKPIEGTMELDVPIDTINFSALLGEKFAGSYTDSNTKSETKKLDRQRLSGKPQQNQANYFLGVMRGGVFSSRIMLI